MAGFATKSQQAKLLQTLTTHVRNAPLGARGDFLQILRISPRQLYRWRRGGRMRLSTHRKVQERLRAQGCAHLVAPLNAYRDKYRELRMSPAHSRALMVDIGVELLRLCWQRKFVRTVMLTGPHDITGEPVTTLTLPVVEGRLLVMQVLGQAGQLHISLKAVGFEMTARELLAGQFDQALVERILSVMGKVSRKKQASTNTPARAMDFRAALNQLENPD